MPDSVKAAILEEGARRAVNQTAANMRRTQRLLVAAVAVAVIGNGLGWFLNFKADESYCLDRQEQLTTVRNTFNALFDEMEQMSGSDPTLDRLQRVVDEKLATSDC